MEKSIVKKYKNKELTVLWEPKKCIHAGICVEALPNVYDPKAMPWIKAENASMAELKAQIDRCPSGALSYSMEGDSDAAKVSEELVVDILKNGPILIKGQLLVNNSDGTSEIKEKSTAFCRCGASKNKPYCDGKHKEIDFIA